ncbi:putative membrane protein YccC [Bacillus fengqiuensis]|nr:putative membrane protein YccC [Bacillus fengqiuensis]
MGLFINGDDHPNVYNNNEMIHASNQRFVRHNSLTELINEQQKANMALAKSIAELKPRNEQLEAILKKESLLKESIIDQINHLNDSNQEMAIRLEKNEEANEQLSLQLNEQLKLQKRSS